MHTTSPFTPLKIIRHRDILDALVAGDVPSPVTVEIDPTNKCNHKCPGCMYAAFKQASPDSLSDHFLCSLIIELSQMGVKSVIFTGGGEPLVHPKCVEAIDQACSVGLEVALVTNGELLTDECIPTLVRACTWIRVSLDAATPDTHCDCHGLSDRTRFETVTKNIRALVKQKRASKSDVTMGLSFLVQPQNFEEAYAAAALAEDMGVSYIQFRPIYSRGFSLETRILGSCRSQVERARDTLVSETFEIYSSFDRFTTAKRDYPTCLACRLVGTVAADMYTYVCCQVKGKEEYRVGNLNEQTFRDIWTNPNCHQTCRAVDVLKCPPCRYDGCNRVLNYLVADNPTHVNFL